MEESGSGNNIELYRPVTVDLAKEILVRTLTRISSSRSSETATVVEPNEFDLISQLPGEGVQQHLISSVMFRYCTRGANRDEWVLQSIWDNVDIRNLDNIRSAEHYEWHPDIMNAGVDDLRTAMVENIHVVMLRTIMDWSRQDGRVGSLQIAWSGSFSDARSMLQRMDNNEPSIQLRHETFELHCHLRDEYIARHRDDPISIALLAEVALEGMPTVIISEEQIGTGEENLCAICRDIFHVGERAKRLPCSHIYHEECILDWFLHKVSCPLCRREF
jgi:hypothetical protein